MKKFFKFYILTFLLFSDFVLFAQPGDNDGGGGLEGDDPPPAPINTKLIWLAILGILFAYFTYKQKQSAKQ
jgi:hypothetical protein